jgi:hypothetical protein
MAGTRKRFVPSGGLGPDLRPPDATPTARAPACEGFGVTRPRPLRPGHSTQALGAVGSPSLVHQGLMNRGCRTRPPQLRLHRRLAPSPVAQGNGADSRPTARLGLEPLSWTLRGYTNRGSPSTAATSSSRLRTTLQQDVRHRGMTCDVAYSCTRRWDGRVGRANRAALLG